MILSSIEFPGGIQEPLKRHYSETGVWFVDSESREGELKEEGEEEVGQNAGHGGACADARKQSRAQ